MCVCEVGYACTLVCVLPVAFHMSLVAYLRYSSKCVCVCVVGYVCLCMCVCVSAVCYISCVISCLRKHAQWYPSRCGVCICVRVRGGICIYACLPSYVSVYVCDTSHVCLWMCVLLTYVYVYVYVCVINLCSSCVYVCMYVLLIWVSNVCMCVCRLMIDTCISVCTCV